MFSLKPRQSKKGIRIQINHHDESLKHEVREMFIGHHTIFSLIGLTVGGTLVGVTLWEWLSVALGLPLTFMFGLGTFVLSGLALHTFDDDRPRSRAEEDLIQEITEM